MTIDPVAKLRNMLQVMAFCLAIATLQYAFAPDRPYGPQIAYSLAIGLITRVTPDVEVVEAAVALGEQLAAMPRLQMGLTRELFRRNAVEHDPDAYLQRETDAFVTMLRAAKAAREKAG